MKSTEKRAETKAQHPLPSFQEPQTVRSSLETTLLEALTRLLSASISGQGCYHQPYNSQMPEPIQSPSPESQSDISDDASFVLQKRLGDRILALYSSSLSVKQISTKLSVETGDSVTPEVVYSTVEQSIPGIKQWRSRPVEEMYPLLWIDGCRYRFTDDKGAASSGTMYSVVGLDRQGKKDVLGLWSCHREGTVFWTTVLTELRNRGMKDVLMVSSEGIAGIAEALHGLYPESLSIPSPGHQILSVSRYASWKDEKSLRQSLTEIWLAETKEAGESMMTDFLASWSDRYPLVMRHISEMWVEGSSMLMMDRRIRSIACNPAPMRNYSSHIRQAFKNKGVLPSEGLALKLAYLASSTVSDKWTLPVKHWYDISQSLGALFGSRYRLFYD